MPVAAANILAAKAAISNIIQILKKLFKNATPFNFNQK